MASENTGLGSELAEHLVESFRLMVAGKVVSHRDLAEAMLCDAMGVILMLDGPQAFMAKATTIAEQYELHHARPAGSA